MKLAARTILVAVTLTLAAPAMVQVQSRVPASGSVRVQARVPASGLVPPAIQRGDFGWQGRPPAQP